MRARQWLPLLALAWCSCTAPAPVPDAGPSPSWVVVHDALPTALLSVWASSDGVLYAVGGNASRGLVLRHDSSGWWEMDPGTSRALWWVHGRAADDVYAVGAGGVVTHFDGTRWSVEREGEPFTLYGVWASPSGRWVTVGGDVTSSQPKGVALSRGPSSATWAPVSSSVPTDAPLFKVWGADETFDVVGERGLIAHGGAGGLTVTPSPTTQRLTTVWGSNAGEYVAGGVTEPVLLWRIDGAWRNVPVPGSPALLNGVAVNGAGEVVAVGLNGYVARGRGAQLAVVPSVTSHGLHAVVATREGFVAVGGDLLGALGHGVLVSSTALEGGTLRRWPTGGVRFDAGVEDAGVEDAGVDAGVEDAGMEDAGMEDGGLDAGTLGPGELCNTGSDGASCESGLSCWFVFGPFKSYCAATCTDVAECGAAYGANACCKVPGPQVTLTVCLPQEACDAGS